jgi:hypothetical protein
VAIPKRASRHIDAGQRSGLSWRDRPLPPRPLRPTSAWSRPVDHVAILDKNIAVGFSPPDGWDPAERQRIEAGILEMAKLINDTTWDDELRGAFHALDRMVFFTGAVTVDNYSMTRPCCDQSAAVFYWEVAEFVENPDHDVHAATLLHDCWHIIQYRRSGDPADKPEAIAREVEAMDKQLDGAVRLGCEPHEIDFWRAYRNDPEAIAARIDEGMFAVQPSTPSRPHSRRKARKARKWSW